MEAIGIENLIVEDACEMYSAFKKNHQNPPKGLCSKFFNHLCDTLYYKYIGFAEALNLDPEDFKGFLSKKLWKRKKAKQREKELEEYLARKDMSDVVSQEKNYFTELGGGNYELGKEFDYLYNHT